MTNTLAEHASPMMKQWHLCKQKSSDALLLFRLGDFYEAFYEDAHVLAKELELTLTKRGDIPMSGIPAHTVEGYIEKLVSAGYLVAIAEQMEDAKQTKGIVKRDITKIISPATLISASLAPCQSNNFIICIDRINSTFGLALLDLSTGEFFVLEVQNEEKALDELYRREPTELLISEKFANKHKKLLEEVKKNLSLRINVKPNWLFEHKTCYEALTKGLNAHSLDAFGLGGMVGTINAGGALFNYLVNDLNQDLSHVKAIKPLYLTNSMLIDRMSALHLNIFQSSGRDRKDSLLGLLNRTYTPMGARLLRTWISYPLLDPKEIQKRQEAILHLMTLNLSLKNRLVEIRDIERLAMKTYTEQASPRDLIALAHSCKEIPPIREILTNLSSDLLSYIRENLADLTEMTSIITSCLAESPPIKITEGGLFQSGVHQELDELRKMKTNNQNWLAKYQADLREKLDIKALKVNFNNAFGYYIEVSRVQSHKMPETFHRKQTLVNTERFISPELKEYEQKILTAEERIQSIEYELFIKLRQKVASFFEPLKQTAKAIAILDTLNSLQEVAIEYDYKKPSIDNSPHLYIENGRHPVVERSMPKHTFVANDTHLDQSKHRLSLITGPNMAGKSTYIRQVALIVIMAQIGSFVPAHTAHIGICDKIFSRIGASDDLSRGQSTFMVEMTETANILNNAGPRSLVILDEIGRGTSTYDGIAIAHAVTEHLHTHIRAKTLFATHYSELTELAKSLDGIQNLKVAVKEQDDTIVFLHKIEKGESDKSYGIHVAELSGLPKEVIEMARTKLLSLEKGQDSTPPKKKTAMKQETQYLLFPMPNEEEKVLSEIKEIDVDKMTPLEALQVVAKWKQSL